MTITACLSKGILYENPNPKRERGRTVFWRRFAILPRSRFGLGLLRTLERSVTNSNKNLLYFRIF